MSWTKSGDHGRGYARCGDIDDILRIIGSEKLPREREGVFAKDGELRP